MRVNIPDEVRRLLVSERKREEVERKLARARDRAKARERAKVRKQSLPLARKALKWSRAVAASEMLPVRGMVIFECRERTRTTARVMPNGDLVVDHVFLPYGGCRIVGRRDRDLISVGLDVLQGILDAIDSGAVWELAKRSLNRSFK